MILDKSAGGLELGLDKAFTTPGWVAGPPKSFEGESDLSCPTASSRTCMTTGGGSEETDFWNGTSWLAERLEIPAGYHDSHPAYVSCWAANGCFTYGTLTECENHDESDCNVIEYPAIWLWNGTKWTFQQKLSNTPLIDGADELNPISCSSATFCQAIFNPFREPYLYSYVWNGSTWSEVSVAVPSGISMEFPFVEITHISCGSPTFCEAIGWAYIGSDEDFIDTWNGQSWSLSKTISAETQRWLGLSCLPEECVIVGTREGSGHESGGIAIRSAGGVFTEKELPLPAGASEHSVVPASVSCPARETCVLAGDYVKTSTGLEEVLVDLQSPQHESGAWHSANLPPYSTSSEGTREDRVSCWSAEGCMVLDGGGGPVNKVYGPELRLEDSPVPANTKLPAITPSAPEQGTAETVSAGTWLHEATSYSYQWELCNASGGECASISGATTTSYTPTEANLGHTLRVKVVATNKIGGESVYTTVSPAVKPPPAPVNTQLPVVSPSTPDVGVAESTTTGTWTREITGYTYQWEVCNATGGECTSISGATSSKYTPVEANVGHTLRAKVTAKNSGGSTPANSATTKPVELLGHFTQTIDSPNSIRAVSCIPSSTDCVVSDSTGKALYATNLTASSEANWKTWSGPSGVSPSQAVACPTTTLCVLADGGDVYYASSLGGSWTEAFAPSYGVIVLSCASASFCIDGQGESGGYIRYSASPASTSWYAEDIAGSTNVTGVFCLSSSFCTAVNSTGDVYVATTTSQIESEKWTKTDIDGTTALNGIVCTSTTSCIAVDGVGDVLNLTVESSGAAKVTTNHLDGTNSLTAVTCSGATCVAVDNVGNVFEATNSGATWTKAYALSDDLTSVSCASTTLCLTADTTGHVTTFRPEV